MHVCACVCVYTCMYTCVHVYTHVHMHVDSGKQAQRNYSKTVIQRKDASCTSPECKDTGATEKDLNGASSSRKLEDLGRELG